MDKNENAERILRLVNNWAMLVIDLPAGEREAKLTGIERDLYADVIGAGGTVAEAKDWSKNIVRFIREMIGLIERSGSASTTVSH